MKTRIEEEILIDAPADVVWRVAGDPGQIADWLPAIDEASLDGDERSCTLGSGDQLVERIVEHSDEERFYAYEIVDSPMPVQGYYSRFELDAHPDHTHVRWTAEFEPTGEADAGELRSGFAQIYRAGLENLRSLAEVMAAA